MSAKFGPAGNSDAFSAVHKSSLAAPQWIAEQGLDCYEYQCGKGVHVGEETARKLAEKICNLRVFEDENGRMNLSLEQVGGALLVVSQFTLYADTSSRRPGFTGAAKPDAAIPLYERFMAHCRERGFDVQHGEFGADMQVDSRNDGPVTILFDTERPL